MNKITDRINNEGYLDKNTYLVSLKYQADKDGDVFHIEIEYHIDTKEFKYSRCYSDDVFNDGKAFLTYNDVWLLQGYIQRRVKRYYHIFAYNPKGKEIPLFDGLMKYENDDAVRQVVCGAMYALSGHYKTNIRIEAVECDTRGNKIRTINELCLYDFEGLIIAEKG